TPKVKEIRVAIVAEIRETFKAAMTSLSTWILGKWIKRLKIGARMKLSIAREKRSKAKLKILSLSNRTAITYNVFSQL
ncbi:MAG: hypothetical protein ACE5K0_11065, partial [Candidatus Methanofastidiosia archaeon]